MSRLLMATPTRLSLVRGNRLNSLPSLTRMFAAKPQTPNPGCMKNAPKLENGYFTGGRTHAVFSDLPKPEGDFMAAWHTKNSKYNLVLLSGILALVGTIALGYSMDAPLLNFRVPDYPYTEDEMEEFAREEERRQLEKAEREQRKQEIQDVKELKIRRRKAKDAMTREVELMQKDIDSGLAEGEMSELVKLTQEREEFESWEKEELKRLDEKEKERAKMKQEREKLQKK